jgi:hypothetical protein
VSLSVLANLAESFQELTRRIGGDVVNAAGPGRTSEVVAALTDMRLTGLTGGSTTLRFVRGRPDELQLGLAVSAEINARFWEVVAGIAAASRPDWMTDPVAESTGKVVSALAGAAPEVELRAGTQQIKVATADLVADVWRPTPAIETTEVVVTGRLEAVDLRSGRFRVVDDVGNRLSLGHVQQPETVAHLINQRVRAVGAGLVGPGGALKGVDTPTIEAQSLPGSWFDRSSVDLERELAKPGPAPGGGADLSDEEYAEFMATIKG